MRGYIKIISILILLIFTLSNLVLAYEKHEPIIIRHSIENNSASNPLIIEGYEISNPKGPCIFIENIEYVIIRNNYLHDCGTDISAKLIAENPRDDDCWGGGTDFMETGALNLFRIGSVKVYNNKLENNDYGIRIDGFDFKKKINGVEVFNNIIHNSHRNHFLWIKDAENVLIYNNDIRHNGLGEFFDNAALERIFAGEDLDCMDGRSQGIVVHACDNVKIYNNFILNSSSDGIGIADTPGDPYNSVNPSRNVEIFENEVVESGEMGVWLAGAHNVSIYRNKIYQSKHRSDEQGGSSGIMLETNSVDVKIFENKIYYNDRYGISITAGTNVDIYDNDISYNGNGGIELRYLDYVFEQGIKNINISNNYINNNRDHAIGVNDADFENLIVEGNVFEKNGGNPIHHHFYETHDFSLHLEDWTLDFERVFNFDPNTMSKNILIKNNIGYPESVNEKEKGAIESEDSDYLKKSEKTKGASYVMEQLIQSWKATLGIVLAIIIIIALIIYYKRKK